MIAATVIVKLWKVQVIIAFRGNWIETDITIYQEITPFYPLL